MGGKWLSNTPFQIVKFYSLLFQFLNKAAFSSKEGSQKTHEREANWEKDNELRKKFGIVEGVRVHLKRITLPELPEDSGKAFARKRRVTSRTKKRKKVSKALNCPYTNIKHTSP